MVDPKSERNYAVLAGATLGYRLADLHWLMLRMLFGARYFGDFHGGVGGVEAGLGFDLFIAKPIVLSASFTGGGVGSAGFLEARAQLGVMLSRLELFGGFSYLNIGGVNLHSPVLGVRLWL